MIPIIFNTRDELVKLDLEKMVYAEADGNFLHITFLNGQVFTIAFTLQKLEDLLEHSMLDTDNRYIRIGRRYIVDRRYITYINVLKQTLILSDLDRFKPFVLNVHKDALKRLKGYLTTSESTNRQDNE